MKMFAICECGSKKLEALKIKFDKDSQIWNFLIGCSKCKKSDTFQVANEHLMGFITCSEIMTAFGPLVQKGNNVVKQQGLW